MARKKDQDDRSAFWLGVLVIMGVLAGHCMGCSRAGPEKLVARAPVAITSASDAGAGDAGEPVGGSDAGAGDAGAPDAGPPVVYARTQGRPIYREPRLLEQCREESRRDAPVVETMESKDDARDRARELAREEELDLVLVLARVAYGETGVPREANDDPTTPEWEELVAFLQVIDGRRGSRSRLEMLVIYSPRRIFPHPEDQRQRWIAELQRSGARPRSWPARRNQRWATHPAWRNYGCPRWIATLEAVERTLAIVPERIEGDAGVCERQPDHWGGAPGVDDEALERGWILVDCGPSRNRFWVVPGAK